VELRSFRADANMVVGASQQITRRRMLYSSVYVERRRQHWQRRQQRQYCRSASPRVHNCNGNVEFRQGQKYTQFLGVETFLSSISRSPTVTRTLAADS